MCKLARYAIVILVTSDKNVSADADTVKIVEKAVCRDCAFEVVGGVPNGTLYMRTVKEATPCEHCSQG